MIRQASVQDALHAELIRKKAAELLLAAEARGIFPTPIASILEAAGLELEQVGGLNSICSEVIEVADAQSRTVFLEEEGPCQAKPFATLHGAGHLVLGWQRAWYEAAPSDGRALTTVLQEQFEEEANQFAAEVIFQVDELERRARELPFGLDTAAELGSVFGASRFSTIWRYVETHQKPCTLLVFNRPECLVTQDPKLRRGPIDSRGFRERFASWPWPSSATDGFVGQMTAQLLEQGPSHVRLEESGVVLEDRAGVVHECVVEGYSNFWQFFILVWPDKPLRHLTVVTPRRSKRERALHPAEG